jgi:hypothetical protein
MSRSPLDINNTEKKYLDEKELFIFYHLLKHKSISTLWSNVFTQNNHNMYLSGNTDNKKLNEFEKEIKRTIERTQSRNQSSVVLAYLLELGRELDENDFSVYCNADYALVESGFLCEYAGGVMHEYLNDTAENRINAEKYKVLNKEQIDFLNKTIKDKDFDQIQFSKLEHPPIKEYREAILNKKAEADFIVLVNKLITDYDGGSWDKEDALKFLEIYRRHNKEELNNNVLTKKTVFYEDWQTKLAGIIFEHIDIRLQISKTNKLEKYLSEYLSLFKNDQLNGKSSIGLTKTFFSTSLSVPLNTKMFGYKKQKEILIKHIEDKFDEYQRNDLDIGNPYVEPEYIGDYKNEVLKISLTEENSEQERFLFVHTMIALFYEEYLEIEDFSYGTTDIFDLYNRDFIFNIKLKNNSNKILEPTLTNIKHNISIENDFLCFRNKRISIERGLKSMAELFLKNANISRGDILSKKGNSLEIKQLIDIGGYKDETAFRDGLKRLRSKLKNIEVPATIENLTTGKYQLFIKYQ